MNYSVIFLLVFIDGIDYLIFEKLKNYKEL